MSNRDEKNQEGYSSDAVYDEVDIKDSALKTKETEFINSAPHYASIAEGHLAKESHYETATIITKTAEKDKPVQENDTKSKCCRKTMLCLSAVMILVVITTCVCFTLAFLEISSLKSEISSLQKVTATSIASSGEEWCSSVECISIPNMYKSLYWLNETHSRTENRLQLLNETLTSSLQQSLSATQQNNLTAETQFQFLMSQFLAFLPVSSCAALLQLHPSSPSGYYWIMSSNGSAVRVYCNMTLSCGNITGGWMKVAELDMTDNSNQCPSTLTQRIDSNKRTCGTNSSSASCTPVIYSIDAIEYSKVCGKN